MAYLAKPPRVDSERPCAPPDADFFAGVGQTRITPPVGAPLLGPLAPSSGVHDDLFVRVLVLGDGAQAVAIVSLDLVGLTHALVADLQAGIHSQVAVAAVLLCCTHTHNAPFTIPWTIRGGEWLRGEGRRWWGELVATVGVLVGEAVRDLRPARLSAGRAPVQVGMNRRLETDSGIAMRPNPAGTIVPWVDVLRVDDQQGAPRAVLFSHAAHPVIVHSASTLISADFVGYAVAELRARLGEEVTALFAQGCGGNINGEPLRGGFEAAEQAGRMLGEAAACAALEAEPLPPAALQVRTVSLPLPLQTPPSLSECEAGVAEARTALAAAEASPTPSPQQLWQLQDQVLCWRDLADRVARGEPWQLPFAVTTVSLGQQWRLLAMTHEVFAEYQLFADRVSSARHTMVVAYTNGCESYIPTDEALARGGYEAAPHGAALLYPYRLPLRQGDEQLIHEVLAQLS